MINFVSYIKFNLFNKKSILSLTTALMITGSALYAANCDSGVNVGNLVQNCGFETGNLSSWTVSQGSIVSVQSNLSVPINASGESYKVRLTGNPVFGPDGPPPPSILSQTISGLTSGTLYHLSFDYYSNVPAGNNYTLKDSANSIITSGTLANLLNQWNSFSTVFTASSNLPLTLEFITSSGFYSPDIDHQIVKNLYIDNVIITPVDVAVPEPASIVLIGSLTSLAAGYRYKREGRKFLKG